MFNPSRSEARSFLIDAWKKRRARQPQSPLETLAADIISWHPEYHALLLDDAALEKDWTPDDGQSNPFLHLSLHLAVAEQMQIDQPPGLRAAIETLAAQGGDLHAALHHAIECLGATLWRAQRDQSPPDSAAYLDCLRRGLNSNLH